jgi:hypothetical protein
MAGVKIMNDPRCGVTKRLRSGCNTEAVVAMAYTINNHQTVASLLGLRAEQVKAMPPQAFTALVTGSNDVRA